MNDSKQKRRWTDFMAINQQPNIAQKSGEFMQTLRKKNRSEIFKRRRTQTCQEIEALDFKTASEFEKINQTDIPKKVHTLFKILYAVKELTEETIPEVYLKLKNLTYFIELFEGSADEFFTLNGEKMIIHYFKILNGILSMMGLDKHELDLFDIIICKSFTSHL